jgi:hypothetical protein
MDVSHLQQHASPWPIMLVFGVLGFLFAAVAVFLDRKTTTDSPRVRTVAACLVSIGVCLIAGLIPMSASTHWGLSESPLMNSIGAWVPLLFFAYAPWVFFSYYLAKPAAVKGQVTWRVTIALNFLVAIGITLSPFLAWHLVTFPQDKPLYVVLAIALSLAGFGAATFGAAGRPRSRMLRGCQIVFGSVIVACGLVGVVHALSLLSHALLVPGDQDDAGPGLFLLVTAAFVVWLPPRLAAADWNVTVRRLAWLLVCTTALIVPVYIALAVAWTVVQIQRYRGT